MKVAAVICELNPIHSGHEYIFNKARDIASSACEEGETACVVAVMSGNFTQRSEPAIYDKYIRAAAAVACGSADIVIELPIPWCISSAEYFAMAGVTIAADIGADFLVFGSESGNEMLLRRTAKVLDSTEYKDLYKCMETENRSLGAAAIKERALTQMLGESAETTPNDILAVEYIRAVKKIGSAISCIPIKRTNGEKVKSAYELRDMIKANGTVDTSDIREYINKKAIDVMLMAEKVNAGPIDYAKFGDMVFRYLRLSEFSSHVGIADSSGGIFERMMKCANAASSYEKFLQMTKTKKYTDSRIRRMQLYTVCGVTQNDIIQLPKFSFILAANDIGTEIIKLSKDNSLTKFIAKPSTAEKTNNTFKRQIEINTIADNLYTLSMPFEREAGYFMRSTPYIKRIMHDI